MFNLLLMFILLIFLFFIFYHLLGKDIFSPPVIMVGVFCISSIFALLNFKSWNINYDIRTAVIILSGIIVFFIPYVIIMTIKNRLIVQPQTGNQYNRTYRLLRIPWYKIGCLIVIDILILIMYQKSIIDLVTRTGYAGNNFQWQYRNISGIEGSNYLSGWIRSIIRIIDGNCYICFYTFINNVLTFKDKFSKNWLYLIPVMIYCIKGFMGGGRQDIVRIIVFAIIVAYILTCQKEGCKSSISLKFIIIACVCFLLILPIFYFALSLTGRSSSRTFFQMISTYIGGPIQSFNQYVMNPLQENKYFGDESLTPILNILGKMKVINYHKTIHLEYRRLGVTMGNIYTFFRRPLHDFGIVGMYVFIILVSCFFAIFYIFYIKNQKIDAKQDIKNIIYAYLIYWIVMSSIEQYSMIMLSPQTILTILLIYVSYIYCFRIRISGSKIIYSKIQNGKKNERDFGGTLFS